MVIQLMQADSLSHFPDRAYRKSRAPKFGLGLVHHAVNKDISGSGPKSKISQLSENLHHSSPGVRSHAVQALGKMGSAAKSAFPTLAEILRIDSDVYVRRCAVLALVDIDEILEKHYSTSEQLFKDINDAMKRVLIFKGPEEYELAGHMEETYTQYGSWDIWNNRLLLDENQKQRGIEISMKLYEKIKTLFKAKHPEFQGY